MLITPIPRAVAEFDAYASLPENRDKRLEFIAGKVVEMVSQDYASIIALRIATFINLHVMQHKLGWVTGADGGYTVLNERYIPDVAFISKQRQTEPSYKAYNPLAPDLAVEVLSPTDELSLLIAKVLNYTRAGTVVWLVDPVKKTVHIYAPNAEAQRLTMQDQIDGGDVLPRFRLPIQQIFDEQG